MQIALFFKYLLRHKQRDIIMVKIHDTIHLRFP